MEIELENKPVEQLDEAEVEGKGGGFEEEGEGELVRRDAGGPHGRERPNGPAGAGVVAGAGVGADEGVVEEGVEGGEGGGGV